jgi:hypothetical protein
MPRERDPEPERERARTREPDPVFKEREIARREAEPAPRAEREVIINPAPREEKRDEIFRAPREDRVIMRETPEPKSWRATTIEDFVSKKETSLFGEAPKGDKTLTKQFKKVCATTGAECDGVACNLCAANAASVEANPRPPR